MYINVKRYAEYGNNYIIVSERGPADKLDNVLQEGCKSPTGGYGKPLASPEYGNEIGDLQHSAL